MLESGPTCSLVAKAVQHLLLTVREFHIASEKCCSLKLGPVCVQSLFMDVVAPDAHQNDCSYLSQLSSNMNCEFRSHYARISMVDAVTGRTSK